MLLLQDMTAAHLEAMNAIEKIVAAAKARKGLSQTQLEKLIGLTSGRLSRAKDGKARLFWDQMVALAKIAEVSLDYLVDERQDEPPVDRTADEKWVLEAARSIGFERAKRRLLRLADDAPEVTGAFTADLPLVEPQRPTGKKRNNSSAG